ncbi:MAG TPA: aminoglycoside adenylyltransferase domain-containing protein [Chloroflexia bacterium]|nr:aminoglycoside adenylyltransferase domain-containing protein [Chloroflexia bacterium]
MDALTQILGDNLVGVYLHGSLAMGCFNPERSDIDAIVVVRHGLGLTTRKRLAEMFLRHSKEPAPVEISFLREQDTKQWQHPLPFDFHYSEAWRTRYEEGLADDQWEGWNNSTQKDLDLAAHIMVTRKRGIRLYGRPPSEVLPAVPHDDYVDAILDDYRAARDQLNDTLKANPVYFVLNACRICAYLTNRAILSKEEGAIWALATLGAEYQEVITRALEIYRGDREEHDLGSADVTDFTQQMDQQLRATLSRNLSLM